MRKLAVLTVFAVSMSGAYALNAQQQLMGTCNAQAKASRAAGNAAAKSSGSGKASGSAAGTTGGTAGTKEFTQAIISRLAE